MRSRHPLSQIQRGLEEDKETGERDAKNGELLVYKPIIIYFSHVI